MITHTRSIFAAGALAAVSTLTTSAPTRYVWQGSPSRSVGIRAIRLFPSKTAASGKTNLSVLLQVAVIQGAVPCSNSNQNQSP